MTIENDRTPTPDRVEMNTRRTQRRYDHRLVRLVQGTGDAAIARRVGVPRSTAAGWTKRHPVTVVGAPGAEPDVAALGVRVACLERRVRRLTALLRIVVALLRVLRPDVRRMRFPRASDKVRLLAAIERSREVLGLRRVLRIVGISPSRLTAWRRRARACALADATSCPKSSPQSLTPDEVRAVREIVTAPEFRHAPTGRLAVLAQRLGRVVASPSTWHRLVAERGWLRPRVRVHPTSPREGIRAERADQIWHVDVSVLRLVDGTRAYIQAALDNYSRRILAWRVSDRLEPGATAALLVEADRGRAERGAMPVLVADAGVENRNRAVDDFVHPGALRRVLARTEVTFSNSMIEAWRRSLKHAWLYLHRLDSTAAVRRLVAFYVEEHNARIPHSAHHGQTPDEMYFGTGAHVPGELAGARAAARARRLEVNRAARCSVCC